MKEHQFTSENQPKNRGRKKNIFNELKKSDVSKTDIINLFKLVLEQTPQQLKKDFEKVKNMKGIEATDDKPMIYYNIVSAIFSDLRKGHLNNIMSILSRWLGHPRQAIEMSGSLNTTNFDVELTDEERKEYEKKLKESMGIQSKDEKKT